MWKSDMKLNFLSRLAPLVFLFYLSLTSGCATLRSIWIPKASKSEIATIAETILLPLEHQGATLGVSILTLEGKTLYSYNADKFLVGASVQKLFTAAWAKSVLPPNFRWKTDLIATGKLDSSGELQGDLILFGGWDPSLSGLPAKYATDPWSVYRNWTKALYDNGVRSVQGGIITVGQAFTPDCWEMEDLHYYFAPTISQFSWNNGLITTKTFLDSLSGNRIQVEPDPSFWSRNHAVGRWWDGAALGKVPVETNPERESSVLSFPAGRKHPVIDPRILAADAFREMLRTANIMGGDSTSVLEFLPLQLEDKNQIAFRFTHYSPSLDSILQIMLSSSDNLWAEMIGITADFAAFADSQAGFLSLDLSDGLFDASHSFGLPLSHSYQYHPGWLSVLDTLGISSVGVQAVDYCGLARRNQLTARTVSLMLVSAYWKWGERWCNLLARPLQRNSTLSNRFAGYETQIVAKTGTMSGVGNIAGYIFRDNKPVVVFCLLVNGCTGVSFPPEQAIDSFIKAVVDIL